MSKFENMNINKEIKRALNDMNFINPTEIQDMAIPHIMSGGDVIIRSKTGSGKTGAYLIPVLNSISSLKGRYVKAIIVLPTRELSLQTAKVFEKMGKYTGLRYSIIYGGAPYQRQIDSLYRADIVIGTPGRIIDLINKGYLDISRINHLILDEADEMLDMGFIDDIKTIIGYTNDRRQTILLSATMPEKIKMLSRQFMKNPENIFADEDRIPETINHIYTVSRKCNKFSILMSYLNDYGSKKSIIFVKTQKMGEIINRALTQEGFRNILLHGGMKQNYRERSINEFRKMDSGILVTTNIAARGLDIPGISDVINFDAPDNIETYTHRVGRSGRMGKNGRAMTIFNEEEKYMIHEIQAKSSINMEHIEIRLNEKYINSSFNKIVNENIIKNHHRTSGHEKSYRYHGRRW